MAGEKVVGRRRRPGPLAAFFALLALVLVASVGPDVSSRTDADRLFSRTPGDRGLAAAAAPDSARPLGPDLVSLEVAEEAPAPLTLDDVLFAAARAWPEQPSKAAGVAYCELGGWLNPKAFDLDQRFGGPMQIDRPTWERFFWAEHAWTWELIVFDLDVHFLAAREIYDRAGGWSPWPVCGR